MTRLAPPEKSARSSSRASLVFGIEAAEPAAQERRSGIAALHPGLVNAVAGAINIAVPDSLETQKEIAMVARS